MLVETWQKYDEDYDIVNLCASYSYSLFNVNRKYYRGGGMLLLSRNKSFKVIFSYEDYFIFIMSTAIQLCICLVYFPPSVINRDGFHILEKLREYMDITINKYPKYPFILLGDFNCRNVKWSKCCPTFDSANIFELKFLNEIIFYYDFSQHITHPSREYNFLDLICTRNISKSNFVTEMILCQISNAQTVHTLSCEYCDYTRGNQIIISNDKFLFNSDHHAFVVNFSLNENTMFYDVFDESCYVYSFDWAAADWEAILLFLQMQEWSVLYTTIGTMQEKFDRLLLVSHSDKQISSFLFL